MNGGNKGFTLIELLVVTSLFGVLMTLVSGLFVTSLNTEQNILNTKRVLGEVSYASEYITRALRMAEKDHSGACISPGFTYEITGRNGLKFINSLRDYQCQEFYLESQQIKTDIEGIISNLTSDSIVVSDLDFLISGASESDNLQPFVTILIESYMAKSSKVNIQTSVSQRNPDIR